MKHLILLMLLSISSIINTQNISPDILLSDGQKVNTSHIFLDEENPTFSLDQSDFVVDWQFFLYTSADKSESILVSQSESSTGKFYIDFETAIIGKDISAKLHQFTNDTDDSIYYIGFIQISTNGNIIEKIEITLNLLPSKVIIEDIRYEYEYVYDWEYDMIFPNGNLYVTASAKQADYFNALSTTTPFCFEFPSKGFGLIEPFYKESDDTDTATYHSDFADWGDFYCVWAINKYGFSTSETILTTDYITDPDILNRLEEIKNSHSELPLVRVDDNITFSVADNTISIIGDKSAISDITICDIQGRVLYTQNSNDDIDIASLNKGIYILSYTDSAGHKYSTKYQKK